MEKPTATILPFTRPETAFDEYATRPWASHSKLPAPSFRTI
jgi:hypothetical protein